MGERYRAIWDSYNDFRCLLLHDYNANGIAFTSSPGYHSTHLSLTKAGRTLHRESFVADVCNAYEQFAADVRSDVQLRRRVFAQLERQPPLGLQPIVLGSNMPSVR